MPDKSFTAKQKEIVARKMGYEGPMNMFDEYLKSTPADAQKYGTVVEKFMAKGGMVSSKPRKLFYGGAVVGPAQADTTTTTTDKFGNPVATTTGSLSEASTQQLVYGPDGTVYGSPNAAKAAGVTNYTNTPPQQAAGTTTVNPVTGMPEQPQVAQVNPALNIATPDQIMATQLAPTQATQITPAAAATTSTAAAPTATAVPTITAATATPAVTTALEGTQAAQGTVSQPAQVQAAQAVPAQTAVGDLQAAQGVANVVQGAPTRTVQEGELVTGTGVDMAKADAALAKNEAAQGIVTADMTVQGQLNNLMTNFETGNPPPWAAASLRNATAQMAARGIGASSLAGQAIIQATLEAATPIAAQDAAVFQQMGMQNLSNRQQTAILTAQQRAQFLGQEFDQTFQTKVLNAAKIGDVANMNFTAQQQVALENARLAQTMDLANLSNRQAVVMATAAQIANLETTNLNNRQQAAVVNAQSFLQMDMANLANEQQVEMFRSQSIVQSLLTDTAAQNAAKQFNATSQMQTDQFFSNLSAQVSQFNSTQTNAMSQFNTQQINAISQFNAETQNQRDQFNAQNRLVIDQSNAQWRRDISTANTAAINRANEFNATKAQEVSMIEYNNIWQQYRDEIEYSFKASESTKEQANLLARQEISSNATIVAATIAKDANVAMAIGNSAAKIIGGTDVGGVLKSGFDTIVKYGGPVLDSIGTWVGDFFDPSSTPLADVFVDYT